METTISNMTFTFGSRPEVMGQSDKVAIFYNTVFGGNYSLKEKNKYVLLSFQQLVVTNDLNTITCILTDDAFRELHPSVIQAVLMMIELVEDIDDAKSEAKSIFNFQKAKYQ